MKRVCVYCGSNPGFEPVYREAAESLGQALVKNDLELVYGGGAVGLMGRLADAVLDAGGVAIGVIPGLLADEVSHRTLSKLYVEETMHTRKQRMFELADAFIALPGGFGTLDELFELLTWSQLGISQKPCGLLNINGYFDPLLSFLDGSVSHGFIKEAHREMLLTDTNPQALLEQFKDYQRPTIRKWVEME